VSRFTAAERAAILRGARDACATAGDLRVTLAEMCRAADGLRVESSGLRVESTALRQESARLRSWSEVARSEGGG